MITVTIFSGGGNKSLEEVNYTEGETGVVNAELSVNDLHYEASGGVCGTAEHLYTNGTITGTMELKASEGPLKLVLEPE